MPVKVFEASKAAEAFHYMAQNKQIGKIVIQMKDQAIPVVKDLAPQPVKIEKNGTYIITGGAGGFGLQIAQWLSQKGAGHIVLLNRSGASAEALPAIEAMRKHGTIVEAAAVDVSQKEALATFLGRIGETTPPIRGVFHCAMVLDDAYLSDLSRARFEKVMAPKIKGALNLHTLLQNWDLDFFVMFSSISSLIGNSGQANYIAANAFLDAFAHYRNSIGMAATTINLGVLSEAGVAARNTKLEAFFQSIGIHGFSNQEALAALEAVLRQKPVQVGIFEVDWEKIISANDKRASSSRYMYVKQNFEIKGKTDKRQLFMDELKAIDTDERPTYTQTIIQELVAKVLRLPNHKIDVHQSISDFGIDSLVSIELIALLDERTSYKFSNVQILKGPSIAELAEICLQDLGVNQEPAQEPDIGRIRVGGASTQQLLAQADQLSEQEIDEYLRQMLEESNHE
jgi:NAD(P)-dependent dehydrogenase (short-subunit alcohol dehydrogenase family)/acyl carrier protein